MAATKGKRVKVTVSGGGYKEGWAIEVKGLNAAGLVPMQQSVSTKAQALRAGQKVCRKLADRGIKSSLIAKNRKGEVQWEWSYPKESDPRPKPGSNRNRGVARQAARKTTRKSRAARG